MNLEDAERWRELERRARERGWTIDSWEGPGDRPAASTKGKSAPKSQFAVMGLAGNEGPLATGDLDAIEAFLNSQMP